MGQATHTVLEQLEHAIGTGHVPDAEKRRAAQLLSRLKSPVQVVLLGWPGAGKSRLINMLAGEPVIPNTDNLPPLEIVFGPAPRTVYLMADGSEQARDGLHLDQSIPPETAILRAELPLPVLNRLSLTELCLSGSPAEQKAIVEWGMSRADIVLWCSQSFDASEQALWSTAPDALKDHSFLVLTKADQLQMKGILSERITQLEEIVAEEFYQMFPLATIQAISSGGADGSRNQETWASSGGKALVDAVQRLVDTGQSADKDNALVFLNRFASVQPDEDVTNTKIAVVPKAPGVPDKPSEFGDFSDDVTVNGTAQVAQKALDFLQKRADLMQGVIADNSPDNQAIILDHCLETATQLSEIMLEAEQSDPSFSGIQDDIMECSDMMILFHLEKTEDAAADAVTLLLQLKKEMSVAAVT